MIPANFQREVNEARQLLLSQDFARALSKYEKIVRSCSGVAVVWFEYGNAASRLGQAEVANRAWQKAIELAPADAELIGLIGHQYQGLRKPEQARACCA